MEDVMIKVPTCVRNIFGSDTECRRVALRLYFAEEESKRIGVVLATLTPPFDSFALNKAELERLLQAKREEKIDQAFVVAAKRNGAGLEYCGAVEADELSTVLAKQSPITGRFGDFYVLYAFEFEGEAVPF
jgi:hypothetical protein